MLSHYWSFLSCNFAGFHLTHPLLTIFGFSVGPTFVSGRAGQKNAQVPVIAHPCTFSITVFKPWYFYLLHFSFLLITVYLGSFGPSVFCLPSTSGECSRWLAQLMQNFSLGKKGGGAFIWYDVTAPLTEYCLRYICGWFHVSDLHRTWTLLILLCPLFISSILNTIFPPP